jgi:hypothetical protein
VVISQQGRVKQGSGMTRRVLRLLRVAWERWLVNAPVRQRIRDFDVSFYAADERIAELAARLDRALALLESSDRRQYATVRAAFTRILVRPGRRSEYWPASRSCVLAVDLLRSPTYVIAGTVVHEAAHARTYNPRRQRDDAWRTMDEHRAIAEELAFARGQGTPSAEYIAWLEQRMESPDVSRYSQLKWRLDALREVGAPRWLIRLGSKMLQRQERHRH